MAAAAAGQMEESLLQQGGKRGKGDPCAHCVRPASTRALLAHDSAPALPAARWLVAIAPPNPDVAIWLFYGQGLASVSAFAGRLSGMDDDLCIGVGRLWRLEMSVRRMPIAGWLQTPQCTVS
jgi:hypothetical protein